MVTRASATRLGRRAESTEPLRSRVAQITGTDAAVLTATMGALRPFSRTRRPAWPSRAPALVEVDVGDPLGAGQQRYVDRVERRQRACSSSLRANSSSPRRVPD